MEAKVTNHHPCYAEMQKERRIVQDVLAGTTRLRDKHKDYLPKFDAESELSYQNRYKTATLLNLYERTVQTMCGLVFKSEIELQDDVPSQIKSFIENVDNEGNHLDVFARKAFEKSFEGHSLILVDYPGADETIQTKADEERLERKPYFVLFDADQIINWQTRTNPVNLQPELALVVLCEMVSTPAGMFAHECVNQYRVFYLDEQNRAAWQLWREEKNKDGKSEVILQGEGLLIGAGSKPLPKLPVAVIYGKRKNVLESQPPLIDLAYKNIEHFQTYSDYKSLIHKTCVPIPYATTGAQEITILSADKLVEVPDNGQFGFAEVSGSSLNIIRQSLEDIKTEIGLLGLSAVINNETNSAEITATESLLNSIEETSHLSVMARSLKDALEQCLIYIAWYLGTDEGGSLELGTAWRKTEDTEPEETLPAVPPKPEPKPAKA